MELRNTPWCLQVDSHSFLCSRIVGTVTMAAAYQLHIYQVYFKVLYELHLGL